MKKLLDCLSEEMGKAFAAAGYDAALGKVTVSNRPDLCEYQCNGAMAGAKQYHKAPIMIANEVAAALEGGEVFSEVNAVAPGFLNLKVSEKWLFGYLCDMAIDEKYGVDCIGAGQTVVVDFGGANVAKPLHIGHLRSAVIGEAVKRMFRFGGYKVIGDAHLGDWGLQMGLVISGIREEQPDLVYFDESFEGDYPEEAPFTMADLERIYPMASGRSKEDPAYKAQAMEATKKLQDGVRGYRALWQQMMKVSIKDLKKNYDSLNVNFDLWNGESSVHDLIPEMVDGMKKGGFAYISDGALVVDVKEETDTKEVPPCMILKSDGASLYNTTDLATILQRTRDFKPNKIVYVVDKRQELYFDIVFRCARKTGLVDPETELNFLGFGTMNGPDGHPFKTRDGGVLRLETLVGDTRAEMFRKIKEGRPVSDEEAKEIAEIVALSALKYGDLSNQASKDYVFDIDRFTSFEGDTGPYLLYTIVRIKSILAKYKENGGDLSSVKLVAAQNESEKSLQMTLAQFAGVAENAIKEIAPHKICGYVYDLANAFNHFYHETQIMSEEDADRKAGLIALLMLTRDVMETSIDMLGFSAPERM